ncbi:hypothetical protein BDW71DRAFT_202505 [Aspergillus fruticulosus]
MFHGVSVPLLGPCLLLGPAYHGPYAVDLVEFYNGKVAYFYASRMMVAGQEDLTEIIGTRGKVTVKPSRPSTSSTSLTTPASVTRSPSTTTIASSMPSSLRRTSSPPLVSNYSTSAVKNINE